MPVGASPDDVNQGEKDAQDLGSGNITRVAPALVQFSPGGEYTKALSDKADFMGESKECVANSRRPKDDMAGKGYTHHQALQT